MDYYRWPENLSCHIYYCIAYTPLELIIEIGKTRRSWRKGKGKKRSKRERSEWNRFREKKTWSEVEEPFSRKSLDCRSSKPARPERWCFVGSLEGKCSTREDWISSVVGRILMSNIFVWSLSCRGPRSDKVPGRSWANFEDWLIAILLFRALFWQRNYSSNTKAFPPEGAVPELWLWSRSQWT